MESNLILRYSRQPCSPWMMFWMSWTQNTSWCTQTRHAERPLEVRTRLLLCQLWFWNLLLLYFTPCIAALVLVFWTKDISRRISMESILNAVKELYVDTWIHGHPWPTWQTLTWQSYPRILHSECTSSFWMGKSWVRTWLDTSTDWGTWMLYPKLWCTRELLARSWTNSWCTCCLLIPLCSIYECHWFWMSWDLSKPCNMDKALWTMKRRTMLCQLSSLVSPEHRCPTRSPLQRKSLWIRSNTFLPQNVCEISPHHFCECTYRN